MNTENIIAIRSKDFESANRCFADFMKKTEECFNMRALANPTDYQKLSADELEKVAVSVLKEIAPSTPFRAENISLISGHKFPDIQAETFYGIEVKSTKDDKWTSTGSSIIENTRIDTVDNIYMLFGKLGGKPQFRCKPYQDCLNEISVTHSPRYSIDMDMPQTSTIFSKMKISYDDFRVLEDKKKISMVRNYYYEKARKEGRHEMPWWMEGSTRMNLSFFSEITSEEKTRLQILSFILFFSQYDHNQQVKFKPITLWLCTHYSILCPNLRDVFTAGGTFNYIENGTTHVYPHIVGELINKIPYIKKYLANPDEELIDSIEEFWDFKYNHNDLFSSWLKQLEVAFKKNPTLCEVPIRKLIEKITK